MSTPETEQKPFTPKQTKRPVPLKTGRGQGVEPRPKDGSVKADDAVGFLPFLQRFGIEERVKTVQRLQDQCGNASVSRMIMRKRQAKVKTNEPTAPTPIADEKGLTAKLIQDIDRGGITVAFYAYHDVKSAAEFQRQAAQFAVDHQAIGIAGGNVQIGAAMEMTQSIGTTLQTLYEKLAALMAQNSDSKESKPMTISIKTLAIFTHGTRTGLQAAAQGAWIKSTLSAWVDSVTPYLDSSPRILLYACSTAGTPAKGMPFAEAVRQQVVENLEERYGRGTDINPEVWGHTTPGHTTANTRLVEFSGGSVSSAGDDLLAITGKRLADLAVQRSGRTEPLSDKQRQKLEKQSILAMQRILKADTGRTDPTNIYVREIPQLGIDRVWENISNDASSNFSDLELTAYVQQRLILGLIKFRNRFTKELAKLSETISH